MSADERGPRASDEEVNRAIEEASAWVEPAEAPEPAPPRSTSRWKGPAAFAGFTVGVVLMVLGVRGAYVVDPQVLTRDAVFALEVARLEVEAYEAARGQFPPDLAAVGLEGLGVTYEHDDSGFVLETIDGWGGVIGYRGTPAGAR